MDTTDSPLRAAWQRWQQTLDEARAAIEATARFRDHPEHRAQAYDCLFEAQAMAYNFAVAPRLSQPRVYSRSSWNTYFYTLGQNSPDSCYGAVLLDGRGSYRLTIRLGDVRMYLMQVHSHLLGDARMKAIGNYDISKFAAREDGAIEIIVSGREQPGNWMRLDPTSNFNFIFVRRWLYDFRDDVGECRIETIEAPPAADEQDVSQMVERIDRARQFLRYIVIDWSIALIDTYVRAAKGQSNVVALLPGEQILADLAGSPSTIYGLGKFDLTPDDALILETEVPDCAYWSVQLGDVWSQALDFLAHQTDMNGKNARIDRDGRCRMVISLTDPGVANWLDPAGRREGTIVYRNYRSKTPDVGPVARLVKLAELDRHLPAETIRLSAAERKTALAERRAGLIARYGE